MILVKIGGGSDVNLPGIAEDLAEVSAPFIVVHGANAVRDAIAAKLGTPTQVVTSVSGFQLALVKQVGNSETEWQAEAGLQQGPSFEIDEDRGVGDQHVHRIQPLARASC